MLELRPRHLEVSRLNPRGIELCLGLCDVNAGRHALVVPCCGELYRPLVRGNGRSQERNPRIEAAQLEVVHGQLGPAAE